MSSSSAESSEYSDSEPEILANPVFVKGKSAQKKGIVNSNPDPANKDHKSEKILQNLENAKDSSNLPEEEFNGIDDTDGMDPEQEYLQWKDREYNRYQRDRQELIDLEDSQAEVLRRENMTESELQSEFNARDSSSAPKKFGTFYDGDDEIHQKLAQRDSKYSYSDHSRPTRFKN